MRGQVPPSTWASGPASSGRDRVCPTSLARPWWCARRRPGRASQKTCRSGRTSTSSGGWARLAGGCVTSRRPPWGTSTGSDCAGGSAGGRTTGRQRPRSNCVIPARSARSTRLCGPRRPGWRRRSAIRRQVPWSPGLAPPCSPAAWPRSPARTGLARPVRPRGGWRPGRPAAGRSRPPGRWAARSPGPGGPWRCWPPSRCGGCGYRWPRWCSRRRCSTGWTAGPRLIRRDMWPPGCSTTSATAWGSGRDAPNAGPFGLCCPCCGAVTWPAVTTAYRHKGLLVQGLTCAGPG